ncbi:DUF938 domain-containing protein [Amphritea opalescens]|uniref:DUF938 domain-containing protein n=1 Tax=Amphritea opalescens TaxID=2490544 RepID=A0A430KRX8_9GAMM|nr:DUF938 domain-containing protein [Amphritea opalescens]RTE66093.1 DUF938 domain-containing protein [Amphritea opalescens]
MNIDENSFMGFSPASARNAAPILQRLTGLLAGDEKVLEVGSGTGQHAVHFAGNLPGVRWLPSDIEQQLPLLQANLDRHGSDNITASRVLNLQQSDWHTGLDPVDLIYSANTLHIIGWAEVVSLFRHLDQVLAPQGQVILYGPFRYGQNFTSDSNAEFDQWLKARNPMSGIRDFEAVNALAVEAGLLLKDDIVMPANNQLLVWQKAR